MKENTQHKHDVSLLYESVPSSAWGIAIVETKVGPEYHAIPEPDANEPFYQEELARLQGAAPAIDPDDIDNMISDVDLLSEYGEEPIILQAAMQVHGRICVMNAIEEDDGSGAGVSFIHCQNESPRDAAEPIIVSRAYGARCDHVITAEWVQEQEDEISQGFLEIMGGGIDGGFASLLCDEDFLAAMTVQEMLDHPEDPEICTQVNAVAIEAPVPLHIFDFALEVAPGKEATEEQAATFEKHISDILGNPPQGGGPQRVSWPRFKLKEHAEKIRREMNIGMVCIVAYTETQDILLGLARKDKDPVLLLSAD